MNTPSIPPARGGAVMVFPPVTEGDVGETLEVDVPAELLPSDLVHVGGDDDEVP